MLFGVHLNSMMPVPTWFLRVRSFERSLRRQPGVVKTHRYTSRRCLLVASWWYDRSRAEAWLQHPAFRRLDTWAREPSVVGFWVEFYDKQGGGFRRGEGGSPIP
jgi:hypothetical protein